MNRIENIHKDIVKEENLGLLLWQLEEIEHFYPCYKTMIKNKG